MKKNTLAVLLSALLLTGCTANPLPTDTQIPPEPPAISEETEQAASIPETTEAPVPETTEAVLEAGTPVTVDGTAMDSVIWEGNLYVPAGSLLTALDESVVSGEDKTGFSLEWAGETLEFSPESGISYEDKLYLSLEEACEALQLSMLEDAEYGRIYCTSGIRDLEVPEGYPVPVLMYHAVSDEIWGIEELFVSPSEMEAQLQYLVDNGYDPIFFEDLPQVDQYDKPVILTFDDGYLDNYTELFPLLQKYGVKATYFIITDYIGNTARSMTWDQVREVADSGLVSVQSHTCTHPELSGLSYEEQLHELRDSKLAVTRISGREPCVICYPTGERNEDTLEIAPEYYSFGIDMTGGLYTTGEHPFKISRYYVSRYTSLDEFAYMIG